MPYRHAWMFVVALFALAIVAFWRSYFGVFATAPTGFHIHGITAAIWMLLLLAQSATGGSGRLAIHRSLGLATFVAVPLFAAGAAGVIHSMAASTVGGNPFYALWGAGLAVFDLLAFAAFLAATGLALRHRRSVWLHAGYMMSTGLLLVSPALGRFLNQFMPGLLIRGPADFGLFRYGMHLSNAIVVGIAVWAYRRNPRYGRPWAIVGALTIVQSIGFELLGAMPAWRVAFESIARLPLAAVLVAGATLGVVVTWLGWTAGTKKRATVVTA
ncbi:hypothetical protein [Sphingomonas sp. RS2018]